MESKEYIKNVIKTASSDTFKIKQNFEVPGTIDLVHAAIGISTEAGELLDTVKKNLYYSKTIDLINIEEELGDLCWYISLAISYLQKEGLDVSWESIWYKNIEKLKTRYGNEFSENNAINRELEKERIILETEYGVLPKKD